MLVMLWQVHMRLGLLAFFEVCDYGVSSANVFDALNGSSVVYNKVELLKRQMRAGCCSGGARYRWIDDVGLDVTLLQIIRSKQWNSATTQMHFTATFFRPSNPNFAMHHATRRQVSNTGSQRNPHTPNRMAGKWHRGRRHGRGKLHVTTSKINFQVNNC